MYSIGREVEVADVTEERAILSLIGPRSVEIAGTAALPENACESAAVAGVECLAVGTRDGIDLIAAAAERERLREALLEAGAVEVSAEAAEILRIESGVPRFGAEMGAETMPAEAGIVERRGQLHQGLLHRPGDGRPPPLQGPAQPPPAGAAAERARREPGAALRLGEKEVGRLGSAGVSPALGPIGLAILRREAEPGAELAVGEDGVTAQVVALPFG